MSAGDTERHDAVGQRQAKNGLILADGEVIVDSYDYDCYITHDRKNSTMTTETTVLLTNKRLVHMVCSESKKRTSKRNVEIPVDRIDSVSSYFKSAKRYCLWGIVTLIIVAALFLAAGILSAVGVIPKLILKPWDAIIAFAVCALAITGVVLLFVFAKYRVCFGLTVYTKDRPDVPCRVMHINRSEGYLADLIEKNDNCFTADVIETEKMVRNLANEVLQIKIDNEAEGIENGNNVG